MSRATAPTTALGTTPYSDWLTIAPLLQALGCETNDQPDSWYLTEPTSPDGNLILAYTLPEQALVAAMASGTAPAEALDQWEQHARALVDLFKANRRRAVLINIRQAAHDLGQATQIMSDRWGQGIEPFESPALTMEEPANTRLQAIAAIAVHQRPGLQALLVQLEACTLPLNDAAEDDRPDIPVDALYHDIVALQNTASEHITLSEHHKTLQEEQDRLTADFGRAQSKIAELESQLSEKQKALKQAEQNSQQLTNEHEQNRASLEAEGQLLLEQLHLVQEELEQKVLSSKTEQKALVKEQTALTKIRAEKATLENQLEALKTSSREQASHAESQVKVVTRLQAQLDKIQLQLAQAEHKHEQLANEYEQTRTSLEEENQLVIKHLHLVQEELELQLIRKQTLESQIQKLSLEQDQAHAAANNQIHRLQRELTRIKDSAAWKAIAPARAIGRSFKRTPPEKRKLQRQAGQLNATPYFDATWYLETYPDVAQSQANPAEHYLKFGAKEGRNPGPEFDTQWYVQTNPDVQETGINPLIHFLNHGQEEGRAPNPRVQISLPSPQEAK